MPLRSLTLVAILASSIAVPAKQAFRAATDVVRLPVIVTGSDGRPVKGLGPEDFEVREDGRAQRVRFFAEGASGPLVPLHLGLLLDTSESMQHDLSDAMTASIQFVNAIEESADVTLVDFDATVRVSRFVPANYPQLFERIRGRKASGMTALYDAVGAYLRGAGGDGQHVLVVYSDGGDSSSTMMFSRLVDLLRVGSNVVVYTIGYLQNQSPTTRTLQQMRLSQMAQETGGRAFLPSATQEMTGIYGTIVEELTSRYTLGYVPDGRPATPGFRKLQVKVTGGDVKGVKVRARSGYYGAGGR